MQLAAQAVQGGRRACVIQAVVEERSFGLAKRLCKVTHGTQKESDALLARPHVGGLFLGLGHPHKIMLGIKTIKGCSLQVELVSKDHNQISCNRHR